jgi:hypothetical protein
LFTILSKEFERPHILQISRNQRRKFDIEVIEKINIWTIVLLSTTCEMGEKNNWKKNRAIKAVRTTFKPLKRLTLRISFRIL